jgi:hypothetical protein
MILIPAQLESVGTRKDKTLKLTFGTNELTPSQAAELFGTANQFGYLAFKDESFKREELDAVESLKSELEDTLKKPSQRLRGVLFRLFEQDNDGFKTFSKYYDSRMEQLINHYKGKLG